MEKIVSRRVFTKAAGLSVAAVAASGLMAACSGGSNDAEGGAAGDASEVSQVIVTMTTGSEPEAGFDPFVSWGCGEHVHEPLIQSTLITTTKDLDFKYDLATSYACEPDGMTWTFSIRDDVVFSDGQPLTAEDVAFTINGILSSDAAQADLSTVSEAVAIDATTVEVRMKRPNNALLYTLAVVGIVPAHAYGSEYGTNPIGSGRYMLEQWDRGQQVILKANPLYYGEAPKIQRVVVAFMEEDASLAAAKSGQADVAYTSAVFAASMPEGYSLLDCASVDSRGISLPCLPAGSPAKVDGDVAYEVGNDVTCDLAIRQAMNCGVDRARMIKHVLEGYGTEAYSVGDGMPWSSEDMKVAFDIEKAKQILADGGWVAGSDGVLVKDGLRASFELLYSASDSVRQALAADFSDQMSELGIEVLPKGSGWDDIYPSQYTNPVLWGWGSNAPVEMYELTHSRGWGNFAAYENESIDAMLDAALAQPTIEASYEYYKKAQFDPETGIGVAPQAASTWIWLANIDHLYFQKEGLLVAEQKPHPHGHGWSLVNNVDQWEWAK
ncbi:MAG: ABC transporter substrate-binding protein [Eggerthellaceae bacterium]|nr:ABC transporter substrate-binding protein [Eggerthellaceae bacterium]